MKQKTITLSKVKSPNGEILAVKVEKDLELVSILKNNFTGIKWNPEETRWELPYQNKLKSEFFTAFKGKAWIDYSQLNGTTEKVEKKLSTITLSQISAYHLEKINLFRIWLENQRYSPNTIKTYTDTLGVFFKYHGLQSD